MRDAQLVAVETGGRRRVNIPEMTPETETRSASVRSVRVLRREVKGDAGRRGASVMRGVVSLSQRRDQNSKSAGGTGSRALRCATGDRL